MKDKRKSILKQEEKKPSRLVEKFHEVVDKIQDFFWSIGPGEIIIGAMITATVAVALGLGHHGVYAIHRKLENQRSIKAIERSIAEINPEVSNLAMDSFAVRKGEDNKYFIDIYGAYTKTNEIKPSYGVTSYEISEELYNKVNDVIRSKFEFNSYGQPIDIEHEVKVTNAFSGSKADIVEYKAFKEIRTIVDENPPSPVEFFEGGLDNQGEGASK